MARRRHLPDPDVPPRLIEFIPGDWHGTMVERFGQWKAARHAFLDEHGEPQWSLSGPNAEYGDFLDLMRRELEVRTQLRAAGHPIDAQQR